MSVGIKVGDYVRQEKGKTYSYVEDVMGEWILIRVADSPARVWVKKEYWTDIKTRNQTGE